MANSGLKAGLSAQDVARLLNDRSADVRIETMSKLVTELEGGTLEPSVRVLAVDLLHRFARDAELAVREAVAWQIYNSPLLSEDTAQRLARDIASVAFPILRHADGLDDALLLAIIGENDGDKHLAIAGRSRVSAAVSDALVETAGPEAVSCLLANEGAAITEHAMHKALDRYGAVEQVNRPLAARPGLPLTVVEKLVTYVSEEIRTSLVTRYHIPPGVVRELVTQGREAATVTLVEPIGGGAAD